jgi:hypothetical protein
MANRKSRNNKKHNRTKKKGGIVNHRGDDKSKTSVSFIMFPSALYGTKKMVTNTKINVEYPSFMDMVNDQIMRVEEAFAYIKRNGKDKDGNYEAFPMHVERVTLGPTYAKN